jgi:hypothetical protein
MMGTAFYSRQLGDVVVDEMCVCGHLKRDHGSVLKKIDSEKSLRLPHEGNCCDGECECPHFVWDRWVTASEMEQSITPAQRKEFKRRECAASH